MKQKTPTVEKHLNIPTVDYDEICAAMKLARENIFNRFALTAMRDYAKRLFANQREASKDE